MGSEYTLCGSKKDNIFRTIIEESKKSYTSPYYLFPTKILVKKREINTYSG